MNFQQNTYFLRAPLTITHCHTIAFFMNYEPILSNWNAWHAPNNFGFQLFIFDFFMLSHKN